MYKTSCLCGIMFRDTYLDLCTRLYGNYLFDDPEAYA